MNPSNIRSLLFSFLCALVLLGWSQPGSAGVVIITGDDADEDGHCYRKLSDGTLDGTLCGSLYPNALNLAISLSTSPGIGIVAIGGANCGTAGDALTAWNDPANGGPGAAVTVLNTVAKISSVNLSDFKMLYIPSIAVQLGGFCGVEPFQLVELNKLAPQIQDFVNVLGGSVIALTEADNPNKPAVIDPYGWLPFPFVILNGDFRDVTTTVNMAIVSPTTTSSNLSQGGVFHNVFETPLPSGFLSLANSAMGSSSSNPHDHLLGKPAYVISTIISPENCTDGIDNDGDGLIDKNDPDCLICGDGILDAPLEQCDDGNLAPGDGCDMFCKLEGSPLIPVIEKELTFGEPEIGIYSDSAEPYTFTITYTNSPLDEEVVINDIVRAEFGVVTLAPNSGSATYFQFVSGSSSLITWTLPALTDCTAGCTLTVDIQTVQNIGKGHGKKGKIVFKPTSCGALPLNDGTTAFADLDEDGIPDIVVGPSNPLGVTAVSGTKLCEVPKTTSGLYLTLGGSGELLLDWDDNGDAALTGFNIYRSTTSGACTPSPTPCTALASVGVSPSEYTDTPGSDVSVCYIVKAVNPEGESTDSKKQSQEVCGTAPP